MRTDEYAQRRNDLDVAESYLLAARLMPRLPFVSRRAFELVCQLLDAECKEHRVVREKYELLLRESHPQAETKSVQALPVATPDPVLEAIMAKSKNDIMLRRHYFNFVTEQRAAGLTEDEIANWIWRGDDDMDGLPA